MTKYKNRKEIQCPITKRWYTLFDDVIFYGQVICAKRDIRELNRQIRELRELECGLQQGASIDDVRGYRELYESLKISIKCALNL